jgi:hypothetical protein
VERHRERELHARQVQCRQTEHESPRYCRVQNLAWARLRTIGSATRAARARASVSHVRSDLHPEANLLPLRTLA